MSAPTEVSERDKSKAEFKLIPGLGRNDLRSAETSIAMIEANAEIEGWGYQRRDQVWCLTSAQLQAIFLQVDKGIAQA